MNGPELVSFRLEQLEEITKRLDEIKADTKEVDTLSGEVKRLRTAFNTLALSIVSAAVVFAFSVMALVGG